MVYGYGGNGHDGAFLSDSIMLISINPQTNGSAQVAEISIPRDWYVPIELGGGKTTYGRINEAYADGMAGQGPVAANQPTAGASVADPTIEHLLGVNVDYFVGVDFTAFKAAVDSAGGVDVNVQHSFTDTQYPHGECDQGDCSYMTVHFNAGMQHMNGATALIFARSRHGDNGEGSDFARSRRQQLVIAALKQKVVSIGGIGSLPDLLNALGDNVLTNLTVGDAEALYGLVKNVNPASIEHVSLDDTNFLYDCGYPVNCGAYYLYAHDRTFASLQHFIQRHLRPARGDRGEGARHVLRRQRSRPGRVGALGARWRSMLGLHRHRRWHRPAAAGEPGDRRERRQGRAHGKVARVVLRRARHDCRRRCRRASGSAGGQAGSSSCWAAPRRPHSSATPAWAQ